MKKNQGRVRLLTYGLSTWFFVYHSDSIDEFAFESDGSVVWLKCYLLGDEEGRVGVRYEMREFRAETSCVEELFEWVGGRLMKSIVRTWIWENEVPVESEFSETYHYFYNRGGMLMRCVRTMTRDGKPWSKQAVFTRQYFRRLFDRVTKFSRRWTIEEFRMRTWRSP